MKQYFRCFFQPLPLFRKCHGLQRNHADARLQRIIFVRSGRNTADNVLARHDEIGSPFRKSLPPFRESSGKNNSREPCHYRRIPECLHYEREKGGKTISLILLPACILAIAATAVPFPVSRFKTEVGVYIGTEYGPMLLPNLAATDEAKRFPLFTTEMESAGCPERTSHRRQTRSRPFMIARQL